MKKINEYGIFKADISDNIYVIGDIHGDYQVFIHCLVDLCSCCTITKVYNDIENNYSNREYLSWVEGCNSVIVFCGDIIHRKRFSDVTLDDECSDIYLLESLFRLMKEARKNGGDIIYILGNHEIMNILDPEEESYTSDLNLKKNKIFFEDKKKINQLINNSYAWIKINDTLIAHGGLCSNYLDILKEVKIDDYDIVKYVNENFKRYFLNFDNKKINKEDISFNLFIEFDIVNKKKHNLFWCREWGYNNIDCEEFKKILEKIDCKKMIIAHCPQFLSSSKPKMINFECLNEPNNDYNLARVDLGMSRAFEYNIDNKKFFDYVKNNFNRKMAVLKIKAINNSINRDLTMSFNTNSIITNKLSCIQYLLLKYGIKKEEWELKNIKTDWIGFKYIQKITEDKIIPETDKTCMFENALLCLLYPCYKHDKNSINSINLFNKFINSRKIDIKNTNINININ
jgi:UDP-2,3-diacylglucosamine pyrophosphatase LpxH